MFGEIPLISSKQLATCASRAKGERTHTRPCAFVHRHHGEREEQSDCPFSRLPQLPFVHSPFGEHHVSPWNPIFFLPFFFILRGFSESSLNATTSSITIPTINLPESGLGLFVENSSCELANGKHKIFRFKEINFWICSMNRDIFEKHLFIKYFVGKWKNLFYFLWKALIVLFFFFFLRYYKVTISSINVIYASPREIFVSMFQTRFFYDSRNFLTQMKYNSIRSFQMI